MGEFLRARNAVDDPGPDVQADQQRFRQVIINLLSNAVKYNHEGGTVTIMTESASVDRIRIFNQKGVISYASDRHEIGDNMLDLAPAHFDVTMLGEKQISLISEEGIYSVTRPILNEPDCQSCHGEKPIIAYIDLDTDLTQAERYFYTGS